MSLKIFFMYLAAWTLVALSPGPAVMCSMAQSTRHGFRSSLAGIAGIQVGHLAFFICIALGLGTLLATARTAFVILRFVGAIYLFYLGLRAILSSFRRASLAAAQPAQTPRARSGLFIQGLLVQLTNPKALLFVSALLPQFIDPRHAAAPQLAILMMTTIAVDCVVLSSYAYAARRSAGLFRASRASAWLERLFGAALVFFGCRLLARKH